MTIEDYPSSSIMGTPIVDVNRATLYPAKVNFRHTQLRSLLCSPEPGILIYPSNKSIFVLDTISRTRECIATLPFSPRCINAKYGWVCAGGKDLGQFAAMKIGSYRGQAATRRRNRGSMGDDEANERSEEDGFGRGLYISSEYGGNICNSVTLHKFESSGTSCQKSDPVYAVLTNNNNTVRIVDLENNIVVRTLTFEQATNHASISPDGRFLVVVGDMRNVYFYEIGTPESFYRSRTELIPIPPFTVGADVPKPAHISTSFSPSSRYCAVASQDGGVFIFDTHRLWEGPSAMVKEIRSPRSGTVPGALRSIQFSSAPWDILVWAENSGRVAISDARCDFDVRQTVEVVLDGEDFVRAEIVGITEDEAYENFQRVLDRRREERAFLARYPHLIDLEDHDPYSDGIQASYESYLYDSYNTRPSPSTRERLRSYEQLRARNSDLWSSPHPASSGLPSSSSNGASSTGAPLPTTAPSHPHSSYRQMPPERTTSSIRRHPTIHNRDVQETLRARLSQAASNALPTTTPGPHNYLPPPVHSSYIPPPAPSAPHSASVSRQPSMRTLRELVRETASEFVAMEEAARNMNESLRRQRLGQVGGGGGIHRLPVPVGRRDGAGSGNSGSTAMYEYVERDELDITGCTMSGDGKKLYVATAKGILEYKINLKSRMEFPRIEPR